MNATGLKLGVNVDHVATLRQARGTTYPSPAEAARLCEAAGAQGITAHLREDRRHIQDQDVEHVLACLAVPVNLEMAAQPEMVGIACRLKPAWACLVPERREELTTEGGLDVRRNRDGVASAVQRLHDAGVRVSLFVDPDEEALLAANEVGADAVELHTGRYANALQEGARVQEFQALRRAAASARQLGLRVHAGHGLDYANVTRVAALPDVEELNIGFAIVARALFIGLERAVRDMRDLMARAREIAARPEGL
jgi:pyridoxine 5-phosphate synthase